MPAAFSTLVLAFLAVAIRVQSQAPGDGDALCTQETIDGSPNPFFAIHPVYSPNERPLMDSRDYLRLLGNFAFEAPWQSVDRDTNNTDDVASEVK